MVNPYQSSSSIGSANLKGGTRTIIRFVTLVVICLASCWLVVDLIALAIHVSVGPQIAETLEKVRRNSDKMLYKPMAYTFNYFSLVRDISICLLLIGAAVFIRRYAFRKDQGEARVM